MKKVIFIIASIFIFVSNIMSQKIESDSIKLNVFEIETDTFKIKSELNSIYKYDVIQNNFELLKNNYVKLSNDIEYTYKLRNTYRILYGVSIGMYTMMISNDNNTDFLFNLFTTDVDNINNPNYLKNYTTYIKPPIYIISTLILSYGVYLNIKNINLMKNIKLDIKKNKLEMGYMITF